MKISLLVPELREAIATGNTEELRLFCQSGHPSVIADFISALTPREAWEVLRQAPHPLQSEIFSHLERDIQVDMTEVMKRDDLARLFADMSSDDRVDLFKNMPKEKQETILPALAQAEREDIRRLASYPEGTAGAVMTSEYATLTPELTAGDAIAKLRLEAPDKETIYYAYVIDQKRELLGFISLKDLILARPEARIRDIMNKDVAFAWVTDDQEEAARKIQKYDLIALPVVNSQRTLVGIITHDDAFDIVTQEHTEDMEKFMAIAGRHEARAYLRTSAWDHFRNRSLWILALALLGFVSGYIVQSFEGLLLQFAILATFMPMLADTGGNTGSQSATLVVRALALKEVSGKDALRVVFKEIQVSLLLGLLLAAVAFSRVLIFSGKSAMPGAISLWTVALAVSIALALQVISSTLIGAVLPLAAARLKFDPAVVASPALTTIVDITGLLIFFTTTKLILRF
ncbi:MAG: magnesium transporter [Clostridiales bacterium]|nr:magnesium transporter [Clostridiales bacterium]